MLKLEIELWNYRKIYGGVALWRFGEIGLKKSDLIPPTSLIHLLELKCLTYLTLIIKKRLQINLEIKAI